MGVFCTMMKTLPRWTNSWPFELVLKVPIWTNDFFPQPFFSQTRPPPPNLTNHLFYTLFHTKSNQIHATLGHAKQPWNITDTIPNIAHKFTRIGGS